MRKITLPTIDTCPVKGQEIFFVSDDLAGFVTKAAAVPKSNSQRQSCKKNESWSGNLDYDTALEYCVKGDLSGVAASDAYLQKFESLSPARQAWARVSDVSGYAPIVTAVLQNHPLSMRRRKRIATEISPLAVCVDLVSSAGVSADKLRKRGALILALVRALSSLRPVELWCGGSSMPYGKDTHHVWWRMDTAPLDLARAAHVMTSPAVSRGLLYSTVIEEAQGEAFLKWPYGDHDWSRKNMRPVLSRVIGSDDMLCIAAPHSDDRLVSEPEAWFDDMLKQYGGVDHET
jgi:hypothetical protein